MKRVKRKMKKGRQCANKRAKERVNVDERRRERERENV